MCSSSWAFSSKTDPRWHAHERACTHTMFLPVKPLVNIPWALAALQRLEIENWLRAIARTCNRGKSNVERR